MMDQLKQLKIKMIEVETRIAPDQNRTIEKEEELNQLKQKCLELQEMLNHKEDHFQKAKLECNHLGY